MRLSPHFTLSEATKSQTASRLGIDNTPSPAEIEQMIRLCENVLEPIRAHFGPVRVNSFYRSPRLNAEIGSKFSSQHVKGQAADIEVSGVPTRELADWIKSNVLTDQIILEFVNPSDPYSGWVHVSYSDVCREQCLTINSKGTFQGFV
jgi:zinc D-Ala-D-Ala carboxypeptidase